MMSSSTHQSAAVRLLPSAAFLCPPAYLMALPPAVLLPYSSPPSPAWSADAVAPPVAINSRTQALSLRRALKATAGPGQQIGW